MEKEREIWEVGLRAQGHVNQEALNQLHCLGISRTCTYLYLETGCINTWKKRLLYRLELGCFEITLLTLSQWMRGDHPSHQIFLF